MTQKRKTNHYNVKFLKGYGFSIKVKDSKIVLKNCSDPFKEPEVEEWFVKVPIPRFFQILLTYLKR